MRKHVLQGRCPTDARTSLAIVALLLAGLAGCASNPVPWQGGRAADAPPYVGEFTGQFVDGKPLYRFPIIEVVGSRRIGQGT